MLHVSIQCILISRIKLNAHFGYQIMSNGGFEGTNTSDPVGATSAWATISCEQVTATYRRWNSNSKRNRIPSSSQARRRPSDHIPKIEQILLLQSYGYLVLLEAFKSLKIESQTLYDDHNDQELKPYYNKSSYPSNKARQKRSLLPPVRNSNLCRIFCLLRIKYNLQSYSYDTLL